MNLQAFCLRGGLGLLALAAVGYTALALWLPPPARSAAPGAASAARPAGGPVLVAAAPAGTSSLAPVAAAVPSPAAPETPPVVHAALPPSARQAPVHRTPEPRAGHPARAVAAAPAGRGERVRGNGHALRTAAESADQVAYPLSSAGGRAYAYRRVY